MTLHAKVVATWTGGSGSVADKKLSKELSNIMEAIQKGRGKITSLTWGSLPVTPSHMKGFAAIHYHSINLFGTDGNEHFIGIVPLPSMYVLKRDSSTH